MIAAEQWYEYQKQYQKYGIDMKPQTERQPRRRERQRVKGSPLSRRLAETLGGDRKVMLGLVLAGAVVLIMVVLMTAYAAKLTYDINKTQLEVDALTGEIEDIDVKIMSSSNISYIENTARTELGMKTPGASNCVYISADDIPEEGFAGILKEKAFN